MKILSQKIHCITYWYCNNYCYIKNSENSLSRQRDTIELDESDRIKIFADSRGNARMVIRQVRPHDQGLYYCTAYSKAGRTKCSASLRVVGECRFLWHNYIFIYCHDWLMFICDCICNSEIPRWIIGLQETTLYYLTIIGIWMN